MAAFSNARSVHPFQLRVLAFELAEAFHISHRRAGILAPPLEERRAADAVLSQQVRHRDTRFRFLEHPHDLALTELRFPHDRSFEPGAVYLRVSTEGGSLRIDQGLQRVSEVGLRPLARTPRARAPHPCGGWMAAGHLLPAPANGRARQAGRRRHQRVAP